MSLYVLIQISSYLEGAWTLKYIKESFGAF